MQAQRKLVAKSMMGELVPKLVAQPGLEAATIGNQRQIAATTLGRLTSCWVAPILQQCSRVIIPAGRCEIVMRHGSHRPRSRYEMHPAVQRPALLRLGRNGRTCVRPFEFFLQRSDDE